MTYFEARIDQEGTLLDGRNQRRTRESRALFAVARMAVDRRFHQTLRG